MMKLKIGDRVKAIIDNTETTGVIHNMYTDLEPPLAIVSCDNGDFRKINCNSLIKLYEPIEAEPSTENLKPGAKIINKKELSGLIADACTPSELAKVQTECDDLYIAISSGIAVSIVAKEMIANIFDDSDEVELTKDELTAHVITATMPKTLVDLVDGSMSESDVYGIGLLSGVIFKQVVDNIYND